MLGARRRFPSRRAQSHFHSDSKCRLDTRPGALNDCFHPAGANAAYISTMNFFRRQRHDPESFQRILFECADSLRREHMPEFTYVVQPEPMEYARAEISLLLLVISIANDWVEIKNDSKMRHAFSNACENLLRSFPDQEFTIQWDYHIVDYAEMRAVIRIHQKMFPGTPPVLESGKVTVGTLLRVLSSVRNAEYLEDALQAMELSARVGEGKEATGVRLFRALGAAFSRRVLNPLGTVSDPTGERFRASNQIAAKIIGSIFFKTHDVLNRL